jgi:hypothetical protein
LRLFLLSRYDTILRTRFPLLRISFTCLKDIYPDMRVPDVEDASRRAIEHIRTMVGAGLVEIVSVEEATWSDSSLGWPEAGRSYAQILMSGYRVIASVSGKEYECRISGDMVRCRPANT